MMFVYDDGNHHNIYTNATSTTDGTTISIKRLARRKTDGIRRKCTDVSATPLRVKTRWKVFINLNGKLINTSIEWTRHITNAHSRRRVNSIDNNYIHSHTPLTPMQFDIIIDVITDFIECLLEKKVFTRRKCRNDLIGEMNRIKRHLFRI